MWATKFHTHTKQNFLHKAVNYILRLYTVLKEMLSLYMLGLIFNDPVGSGPQDFKKIDNKMC